MKNVLKIAGAVLSTVLAVANITACGGPVLNASDVVSNGSQFPKEKPNLKGVSMNIIYSKEMVEEWAKQNNFEVKNDKFKTNAVNSLFHHIRVGLRHSNTSIAKPLDQLSTPKYLAAKLNFADLSEGSWSVYVSAETESNVVILSDTKPFNVTAGNETIATFDLNLPENKGKIAVSVNVR